VTKSGYFCIATKRPLRWANLRKSVLYICVNLRETPRKRLYDGQICGKPLASGPYDGQICEKPLASGPYDGQICGKPLASGSTTGKSTGNPSQAAPTTGKSARNPSQAALREHPTIINKMADESKPNKAMIQA
jgi:hypothetical protein